MLAGRRSRRLPCPAGRLPCPAGRRPIPAGRPTPSDAGYSLIETIVAIGIIGIVMAALTAFYVRAVSVTEQQSGRQVAIQFALDGIDQVRALAGSRIVADLPPGDDKRLNGLVFSRTYQVLPCWQPAGRTPSNIDCVTTRPVGAADSAYAEMVQVGVTVTWVDKACPGARCTYTNTTLVSSSSDDPVFRAGGTP